MANKTAKLIGKTTIVKSVGPLTVIGLIMDISFGCP